MRLVPSPRETIEGVGQDLRAGWRSGLDVLEECLARIDEREPQVRAWVLVDREGARARARELDADLAAGRWHGPLHGIPIGIKDIVDVAGLPTAAGFSPWANRVAREDAPIVARLRAAGAVILGKTVTTQFAWIDPPVTANPWDLGRTPGGSSSGSAAAVACGMCLGAIGSQTGGSITRPAAFCGVAGCKPTHGLLSLRGILPLAPSLDHPGPIAGTVRDLALLWDAIAGPEGRKPPSSIAVSTAAPRLGRLRGFFDERAEPSMRQALEGAIEAMIARGAEVCEPRLPEDFGDVLACHRAIMAAEAAAWHEPLLVAHPDAYQPRIRALVEEGLALPAAHYIRCRQHQEQLGQAILACFDDVDALAVPAAIGPAPDRTTTGDPIFNSPWSYTGLPTVSFPIAVSPDGLPMAIQLVGPPLGEAGLFRTALWCQDALGA